MDLPPDLDKALPAIGGSLLAVILQSSGLWARRVLSFFAGVYLAYIFGDPASYVMNSTPRVGAAVVAIFGVAIVRQMLDGIAKFDVAKAFRELWLALLKRVK